MTQAQLAEAAGVATNTLKQYESGRIRPGTEALSGYARAGINVRYLLLGEGAPLEADGAYPSSEGKTLVLRIGEGAESWRGEMPVSRLIEVVLAIAAEVEHAEQTLGMRLTDIKRRLVMQHLVEESLEAGNLPRAGTVARFVRAAG